MLVTVGLDQNAPLEVWRLPPRAVVQKQFRERDRLVAQPPVHVGIVREQLRGVGSKHRRTARWRR